MPDNNIDKEFRKFRRSCSKEEFNDVEFLMSSADQFRSTLPDLASKLERRAEMVEAKAQVVGVEKAASQPQLASGCGTAAQEQSVLSVNPVSNHRNDNSVHISSDTKSPRMSSSLLASARELFFRFVSWGRSSPLFYVVIAPTLLYALYLGLVATERYESNAQLVVQQPDGVATMDPSLAVLAGVSSSASVSDNELVKAYMLSGDMLDYLDGSIGLKAHYSDTQVDFFSRLGTEATEEDFLAFYHNHVSVDVDITSGIINVSAQGFDARFARLLAENLVSRAEWYINEVSRELAFKQLEFAQAQHEYVESKLRAAQANLQGFQEEYKLLDPAAEGAARQQITYELEGQISRKAAELGAARTIMSDSSPQVVRIRNEIEAYEKQLDLERSRLALGDASTGAISEVIGKFADLKVDLELAIAAYSSSQISLEKTRMEALRKIKYLVVVQSARLPEDPAYPTTFYNVSLFAFIVSIFFAIVSLVASIVRELK